MARTTTKTAVAVKPDLLTGVAKRARREEKNSDKELPSRSVPAEMTREVEDLITLATVHGELNPLVVQYKTAVGQKLLDLWVEEMWATKRQPRNFRVPVMKLDEAGRSTLKQDMSLTFQVRFSSEGLSKEVPEATELPEGVTVEDKLLEALTSEKVGLSQANAMKLLNPETGEITVEEQVGLAASLNDLMLSETARPAVEKLLVYLTAEGKRGQKTVTVPLLTSDEAEALLTTRQVVTLREGFFERAFSYCRTKEELGRLIRFARPSLSLGNFEFGVSDKQSERVERMSRAVREFLSTTQE